MTDPVKQTPAVELDRDNLVGKLEAPEVVGLRSVGERPWPADRIERRPLVELVPYARNARTHSADQIEQIARSIEEWGFTVPVLVDEAGMVICGHGRVMAAARLGLVSVPVMVARGWTPAQVEAYRIADNKIAANGGWDETLLGLELADLTDLGFDLTKLGYSQGELRVINGADGAAPALVVREVPTGPVADEFWISVRGPLAQQADALQKLEVVMKELAGVRVELGTSEME